MDILNVSGQSMVPSRGLLPLMRGHPLFFFYLIAFSLTWIYEVSVLLLLHLPLIPWIIPAPLLGPTLAAFIMTAITAGRPGVLRLLRRYVLWRVQVRWYLFVLLGIPALLFLSYLALPGALAAFRLPAPTFILSYLVTYIFTYFGGGPFFEEPGWRGFALPRLQERSGPLVGTLILGVLWGLWHLPLFLIPGYNGAGSDFVGITVPFIGFVIAVTAIAFIFTWVFNNTRGSLLLAMLLHASINTASDAFLRFFPALPTAQLAAMSSYIAFALVALVIIAATRGRLSYERYRRETKLPAPHPIMRQAPLAPFYD